MRSLFITFIKFMVALIVIDARFDTVLAAGTPMKTVCTLTLNSKDEGDSFREHFSPKLWNFVELTEGVEPRTSGWLPRVCEKKVSCDVLVISGHFAGTFFGDSELTLAMDDLENASCNSKCDGIMKKPKEVFLFGCNTLANKEKDTRTPEQYQNVLLADGFSRAQSAEIVAFRYSALGDSFKDRMAQAFSSTPRIFGFSALAPSGVNTKPMLSRYLDQTARSTDRGQYNLADDHASSFKHAFPNTTVDIARGLFYGRGKNTGPEFKPYCFLRDEKIERLDKIKFVKDSLEGGRAFGFITHISGFAKLLDSATSPPELQALDTIRSSPKIAAEFEKYLRLRGDVYRPVRLSVLSLMLSFKMMSPEAHAKRVLSELKIDLTRPLPKNFSLEFCTTDLHSDLSSLTIPESRWREAETLAFLRCLAPGNTDIHERLVNIFTSAPDHLTWFAAGYALELADVHSPPLLTKIADAAESHRDEEVRHYAIDLLGSLHVKDVGIQRRMAKIMRTSPDYYSRMSAASSLGQCVISDSEVIAALRETFIGGADFTVRDYAELALKNQGLTP
ncbi:hypothetical protein BH10BDE1_BH10BDE1_03180 [soil metagenome]